MPLGARRASSTAAPAARSPMKPGRDHWWHELDETASSDDCPAEPLDSRASALRPLHLRHHRQAQGHPPHHRRLPAPDVTMTMKWVFDLQEEDTYWCTADIGWVTGHSYIVYGPLSAGATSVMYEGAPDYPAAGPLLAHHREVQGQHLLHLADRHPRVHQAGRPVARRARSVEPAPARLGRRADQSGRLGVVPQRHRQGPLPHRRHLVADRNRRAS